MIYASKGNNVYINFFESSEAEIKTENEIVSVSQECKFPYEGKNRINVKVPAGTDCVINLRIPIWAKDFRAAIDSNKILNKTISDGYLVINLSGKSDYIIDLDFNLPLRLEELAGNYVICRGPEVLALDTRDNIDTWLGAQDDLISLPEEMKFIPIDPNKRYQWPGPTKSDRRRYLVKVNDGRTDELREVILTPYADAGNEGAAFRTAFPKHAEENYPSDWNED
jgi:hypothetical protein